MEDLPEELCGKRLTYLKVSCSITGYQPSPEEIEEALVELGPVTESDPAAANRLTSPYFACYGALISVAVFPPRPPRGGEPPPLDRYPHIIDFEPKTRDFYQVASETGEVLSGSTNRVSVDKSFMLAATTEESMRMDTSSTTPQAGGGSTTTGGGFSTTRRETDQLNLGMQSELTRERRERQSTTTQLSQMYNLLSSYHVGTNRTVFLMLPRPHVLQPTARRTFVQGLRIIEGIQDFFLVVVREAEADPLRIEVRLDTGHFPDDAEIITPTVEPEREPPIDVNLSFETVGGLTGTHEIVKARKKNLEHDGFVFDDSKGNGGAEFLGWEYGEGIQAKDVKDHSYRAIHEEIQPDGSVVRNELYAGVLIEKGPAASEGTLTGRYRVHLKREKETGLQPVADLNRLLVASRRLCTGMRSEGRCVHRVEVSEAEKLPPFGIDIAYEDDDPFMVDPGMVGSGLPDPTAKNPYHQKVARIRRGMLGPASSRRYPPGAVRYRDTAYFQRRLARLLPKSALDRRAQDLARDLEGAARERLGDLTLKQLLTAEPVATARRLGVSIADVVALRRRALAGLRPSR
jgi:hypothetical protein